VLADSAISCPAGTATNQTSGPGHSHDPPARQNVRSGPPWVTMLDGDFDFVSYFECADADVPVFHDVCDALHDVTRNPEWAFVREGPTWHGRRTATWAGLFS
jgi:hypothetical protein